MKLVDATIESRFIEEKPRILIGDKAYDSDKLDQHLVLKHAITLVAPHRSGRAKTQDGRFLRRYKRRWKVERLFAWLFNFRRLVVRYERYDTNFLGLLHLACAMILLRRL